DECDLVYGGGFYDGAFNTDPVINTNRIRRAYMTACLHPDPKQALEIGLSSGSWAQVLASYSKFPELTIVEINPAYLQLIALYPEVASILTDPKVAIHCDDGRRWLNRNPGPKYDLILMNTTMHVREQTTLLL